MDTDVWHRFAPFFADVPMPKGVCLTVSTEGNISLAIDNANSMYKKAKEIDYPLGTALALRAIGNTYLSSSTPQVAIGSYEEAIEIMQQIPEADIYLKNALSQMILIKLNNRQMAGIEKDINYLEALCDKRPDSPCYFYLPCCRAFYVLLLMTEPPLL